MLYKRLPLTPWLNTTLNERHCAIFQFHTFQFETNRGTYLFGLNQIRGIRLLNGIFVFRGRESPPQKLIPPHLRGLTRSNCWGRSRQSGTSCCLHSWGWSPPPLFPIKGNMRASKVLWVFSAPGDSWVPLSPPPKNEKKTKKTAK